MARGSSQSQAATSAGALVRDGPARLPRVGRRHESRPNQCLRLGSLIRRRDRRRKQRGNMLPFYTDDAPGLKISPTVVLVMSLFFIGFGTALHVFSKLRRNRTGN